MRADMAKVIVERPRHGSRSRGKPKGHRKAVRKSIAEGGPVREGIRRPWRGGTKGLNEHLGPLRRYLDGQVGRPWDKVFSEICTHINRNSAVQDHVRDHVEDYVARNVILVDGVPCNGGGGWGYGRPLAELHRRWYVCPKSGLLRRVKRPGRKRPRRPKPKSPPAYVVVNEALQCRYLEGAWHLVTLAPLPPAPQRQRRTEVDVWLGQPIAALTPGEARRQYGAGVWATSRRRLGRNELRHYPISRRWWR